MIIEITKWLSFVLGAYPLASAASRNMLFVCYTLSLVLAYCITLALLVTAFCMHGQESNIIIMIERRIPSSSVDSTASISVVFDGE